MSLVSEDQLPLYDSIPSRGPVEKILIAFFTRRSYRCTFQRRKPLDRHLCDGHLEGSNGCNATYVYTMRGSSITTIRTSNRV